MPSLKAMLSIQLKSEASGDRGGSVVKSICYSCREWGFSPITPVTTVSGDQIPSSGLCRHQAPLWYMCIHVGNILIHVK